MFSASCRNESRSERCVTAWKSNNFHSSHHWGKIHLSWMAMSETSLKSRRFCWWESRSISGLFDSAKATLSSNCSAKALGRSAKMQEECSHFLLFQPGIWGCWTLWLAPCLTDCFGKIGATCKKIVAGSGHSHHLQTASSCMVLAWCPTEPMMFSASRKDRSIRYIRYPVQGQNQRSRCWRKNDFTLDIQRRGLSPMNLSTILWSATYPVIEAPSSLLVSAGVRQEMNQKCFQVAWHRADSDFPCWNHTLKAWNRTHLRQRPSQGWIKNNSKWISTLLERVSSVFFSRLSSRSRFRFACLHKKSLEWHWCDEMSFIAVLVHLWSVTVFQEFDSSLILKWSWLWDVLSAGKVHRKQMKQIISLESW